MGGSGAPCTACGGGEMLGRSWRRCAARYVKTAREEGHQPSPWLAVGEWLLATRGTRRRRRRHPSTLQARVTPPATAAAAGGERARWRGARSATGFNVGAATLPRSPTPSFLTRQACVSAVQCGDRPSAGRGGRWPPSCSECNGRATVGGRLALPPPPPKTRPQRRLNGTATTPRQRGPPAPERLIHLPPGGPVALPHHRRGQQLRRVRPVDRHLGPVWLKNIPVPRHHQTCYELLLFVHISFCVLTSLCFTLLHGATSQMAATKALLAGRAGGGRRRGEPPPRGP